MNKKKQKKKHKMTKLLTKFKYHVCRSISVTAIDGTLCEIS